MTLLEALPDGNGTVLLIYGRDKAGLSALVSTFRSLASGQLTEAAVHEVPGVIGMGGCQLVATTRPDRNGIWKISAPASYAWAKNSEGWRQASELAQPVADAIGVSGAHFQYLEDDDAVSVILSTERAW